MLEGEGVAGTTLRLTCGEGSCHYPRAIIGAVVGMSTAAGESHSGKVSASAEK